MKKNNIVKSLVVMYLILDMFNKIMVLNKEYNLITFILLVINIIIYTFIID